MFKNTFQSGFLSILYSLGVSGIQYNDKGLCIRDLATKFDKNMCAAPKLSEEAKLRDVTSLEGHVLLKKLRGALESLRGRLTGRNKEDVEKAISLVYKA